MVLRYIYICPIIITTIILYSFQFKINCILQRNCPDLFNVKASIYLSRIVFVKQLSSFFLTLREQNLTHISFNRYKSADPRERPMFRNVILCIYKQNLLLYIKSSKTLTFSFFPILMI